MQTKYSEEDFYCLRHDLRPGPDFEWYACDMDGYLAAFTNAGFGFVPPEVLEHIESYKTYADLIYQLPFRSHPLWEGNRPNLSTSFEDLSRLGLHAYDWDYYTGGPDETLPYRILCRPSDALNVRDLPPDAANYIRSFRFEIRFSASPTVNAKHLRCSHV